MAQYVSITKGTPKTKNAGNSLSEKPNLSTAPMKAHLKYRSLVLSTVDIIL